MRKQIETPEQMVDRLWPLGSPSPTVFDGIRADREAIATALEAEAKEWKAQGYGARADAFADFATRLRGGR